MINNILMQALSHVKSNSSVSPSYQLNRSESLYVCALAIHVSSYGKFRYLYRVNVAYRCLRELVCEFNNETDVLQVDEMALRRLLLTTEFIPRPDTINH